MFSHGTLISFLEPVKNYDTRVETQMEAVYIQLLHDEPAPDIRKLYEYPGWFVLLDSHWVAVYVHPNEVNNLGNDLTESAMKILDVAKKKFLLDHKFKTIIAAKKEA